MHRLLLIGLTLDDFSALLPLAQIVAARDPIYPPGKDPPQYPFGQPRTRKESPTRRLAEPLPQLKPGQQGHGSIDGFFRGLQALDDYRAAVVPKLRLDGIGHGEDPKQQKRDGGVEYDVGVMYKSELHGRLMEYFHGNGALAEDCLQVCQGC